MNLMSYALLFLLLTGCSTLQTPQKTNDVQTVKTGLSAQQLGDGACGLFFWDQNEPRSFVFFHEQNSAEAKLFWHKQELLLTAKQDNIPFSNLSDLEQKYQSSDGTLITIKGRNYQEVDGGYRINTAVINVSKPGVWQEILPVSGVSVCK
jgi:hypothetical protein